MGERIGAVSMENLQVEVFCNGQFERGHAGFAALLIASSSGAEVQRKLVTDYVKDASLNAIRAQLTAALIGIRALHGSLNVTVISNLDYLPKVMRKQWQTDKNGDLLDELCQFANRHRITWLHSKEYPGNPEHMAEVQAEALNALREQGIGKED